MASNQSQSPCVAVVDPDGTVHLGTRGDSCAQNRQPIAPAYLATPPWDDALLSGTTSFHRALRRAGVDADFFVFEAMPHCHWYALYLSEAKKALQIMVDFFDTMLGR